MTFKGREDFLARVDRFVEALIEIQRRHYYWFESRHGLSNIQEHDVIANHVVISVDFPKLKFGYWDNSELPPNIRDECNRQFDKLFVYNSHSNEF